MGVSLSSCHRVLCGHRQHAAIVLLIELINSKFLICLHFISPLQYPLSFEVTVDSISFTPASRASKLTLHFLSGNAPDLLLSWGDDDDSSSTAAPVYYLDQISEDSHSKQEESDLAFALALEAQFKEESRRATSPAAPTAPVVWDSHSMVQCPLCGNWIEAGEAEYHANLCLDGVLAAQMNEEADSRVPAEDNGAVRPGTVINKEEKHDPVTKEPFECPICTETIAVGQGYAFSCRHAYCGECLAVWKFVFVHGFSDLWCSMALLQGYYKTLVMNGKVLELKCPTPICEYMCTPRDVRIAMLFHSCGAFGFSSEHSWSCVQIRCVSPDDLYAKYVEFSRNAQLSRNPNVRWCPTPGCDTAVEREDDQSLLMRCETCNFEFCFQCAKGFHAGKTCEQANRFSFFGGKDIRVVIWEKLNTKPCPHCKAPIQKHKGCNRTRSWHTLLSLSSCV